MSLAIRPIALRASNAFVEQHHRHHRPARGCVFCTSAWDGDRLVGVAIVGRPVARGLQDGLTCEVTRCCTDGTPNACSKLYATVARVARALGYTRIVTYTLAEEGGASLRAAGWTVDAEGVGGGSWYTPSRPRVSTHPLQPKVRWTA